MTNRHVQLFFCSFSVQHPTCVNLCSSTQVDLAVARANAADQAAAAAFQLLLNNDASAKYELDRLFSAFNITSLRQDAAKPDYLSSDKVGLML